MVKVEAVFSDYDGTLAPLEAARANAIISPRLRRLLTKVSKMIPIGIVTTKDLDFIVDRVTFAHGVAATCGLEMKVGDRLIIDERVQTLSSAIEKAYREALSKILQIRDEIVVERKTAENGNLIAFCIDWRLSLNWAEAREKVKPIIASCKEAGLYVVESGASPFANVYSTKVDKGNAFLKLRKEMNITGPVMYLGDSEADNPAFQQAEISVGIKHRRIMEQLFCKYRLEFVELEGFFSKLLDSDLDFNEEMVELNPKT